MELLWGGSKTNKLGRERYEQGYRPKHPVLLVPGFVSSALKVEAGADDWIGQRIWVAPSKMGFVYLGAGESSTSSGGGGGSSGSSGGPHGGVVVGRDGYVRMEGGGAPARKVARPDVFRPGFLHKRTSSDWVEYYFRIENTSLVYYVDSSVLRTPGLRPEGEIELDADTFVKPHERHLDKPLLVVESGTGDRLVLKAPNFADRDFRVMELNRFISLYIRMRAAQQEEAAMQPTASAPALPLGESLAPHAAGHSSNLSFSAPRIHESTDSLTSTGSGSLHTSDPVAQQEDDFSVTLTSPPTSTPTPPYSNDFNSNGLNSNGLNSNGLNSNGLNSNGLNSNGSYPNPNGSYPNPNGSYPNPNGSYPNPNGSYPNPNGSYPNPNGSYPNPNGSFSNGSYPNGSYSNGYVYGMMPPPSQPPPYTNGYGMVPGHSYPPPPPSNGYGPPPPGMPPGYGMRAPAPGYRVPPPTGTYPTNPSYGPPPTRRMAAPAYYGQPPMRVQVVTSRDMQAMRAAGITPIVVRGRIGHSSAPVSGGPSVVRAMGPMPMAMPMPKPGSGKEPMSRANGGGGGGGMSSSNRGENQRKWIRHICLAEDGCRDKPGIRVRPVEGFEGCCYLVEGSGQGMLSRLSYVFGPLVENLRAVGYTDRTMVARPYDWRLPPHYLELRDKYFSSLKEDCERMYEENGHLGVCLVAHSMGNRVVSYFVNWAEKNYGRAWLDKHIQSWIAVGAPWLGAPKALRSVVSGEKGGLNPFLTDEEAVVLNRAGGSTPWLFPVGQSYYFEDSLAFSYVKSLNSPDDLYLPHFADRLLKRGRCEKPLQFWEQYYQRNALYGGAKEDTDQWKVLEAPPVNHLCVIYGINVETEVFYFYRPSTAKSDRMQEIQPLELDPAGDADKHANRPGYVTKGGIAYETPATPQKILFGEGTPRCGDGTVPYCSLYYPALWRDAPGLTLDLHEIEGVNHREILKDARMMHYVLDTVCSRVAEAPAVPDRGHFSDSSLSGMASSSEDEALAFTVLGDSFVDMGALMDASDEQNE